MMCCVSMCFRPYKLPDLKSTAMCYPRILVMFAPLLTKISHCLDQAKGQAQNLDTDTPTHTWDDLRATSAVCWRRQRMVIVWMRYVTFASRKLVPARDWHIFLWRYLITSQDQATCHQPSLWRWPNRICTENSTRFDNLARGFSVPIEVMQSLSIFHASSDGLRLGFYFPNTPPPSNSGKWSFTDFYRDPPKKSVIILMVTGILCGGVDPIYQKRAIHLDSFSWILDTSQARNFWFGPSLGGTSSHEGGDGEVCWDMWANSTDMVFLCLLKSTTTFSWINRFCTPHQKHPQNFWLHVRLTCHLYVLD